MTMHPASRKANSTDRAGERGLAMILILAMVSIVTLISISLIGLMNTDVTHASVQYAVARSFYIAQAGLQEAEVQVSKASDPAAYRTPGEGVTVPYGGGQFTYWVDAGLGTPCGDGFVTLEALGQIAFLNRSIPARVRACGVPGTPFLAALFGVSRIQFEGASSRLYLAPYMVGTPGGGGSVGSFTEINFADTNVALNALSEVGSDTVTLRDGTFYDYQLFGFPLRPSYNANPAMDPAPWILSVAGDLIKAQPSTGGIPNRCGTQYACLNVGNDITDVASVPGLRTADYVRHAYVRAIREEILPQLSLSPDPYRAQAAQNTANAALNWIAGLKGKPDSSYTHLQFSQLMTYLAAHPEQPLQGTIFVDGTVEVLRNMTLGSASGNVTLAVAGDLIVDQDLSVTILHDLSTAAGRSTPGIVVFGLPQPDARSTAVCGGRRVNGSGRLVLCGGSKRRLTVDGLIYTADGMDIEPGAFVDQIGAMYHNNRGTSNSSFTTQDAALVLRFDPLALSVFGNGISILSWQQLH